MARVILLNGPGSVGKTTVARELQAIARGPLLHVAMDGFLDMLPDRFADHDLTFRYLSTTTDGNALTEVVSGPAGGALLRGMRRAVAALAAEGLDIVVDDVMLGDADADYREVLQAFRVCRVGLKAPLATLEARESTRGDRVAGLSRDQWHRVHSGVAYDLEIDTSLVSAKAAARMIADKTGL